MFFQRWVIPTHHEIVIAFANEEASPPSGPLAKAIKNQNNCVVVCRSGVRSNTVAGMLTHQGLHSVSNLNGGMKAFKAAVEA